MAAPTNSTQVNTAPSTMPSQVLPFKKKDEQWGISCVDYFLNNAMFKNSNSDEIFFRYERFYSGDYSKSDLEEFEYTKNPINGAVSKITTAKMRSYNIIQPTVNLLFGEKAKRPLNDTVVVTNSDSIQLKEQIKVQQLKDLYTRILNEQIAELQGEGKAPVYDIEKIISEFDANYKDYRAIVGQRALEYIKQYNDIYNKFQESFKDFVISGRCFTIKEIINDEIYYSILEPQDVDFDLADNEYLVENAEVVNVRRRMTLSTIVDYFRNELSDEDIRTLETAMGNYTGTSSINGAVIGGRFVEVLSTFWRSKRQRGIMYYVDETGTPQMKDIEEDHEGLPFGAKVDWYWVDEIWEGHKIEIGMFKKHLRVQPYPIQRVRMTDSGLAKQPVNGVIQLRTKSGTPWSLLGMAIPYQQLYLIIKMKLEASVAKAKDVIALIDINSVPDKLGINTFFEYLDKLGIGFVDFNKDDVKFSNTHQSMIDLTNKSIEYYLTLLASIVSEMERALGITKERQGQIGHYQGKGVTERSVVQSSHITEDLYRMFGMFEKSELQGLLDLSKFAWVNGKKVNYMKKDGEVEMLSVNPLEYCEAEMGVFVDNSVDAQERLTTLRSMVLPMLQNQTKLSTVVDILELDSFAQIKQKIKEAEKLEAQQQELAQKAEQEAELARAQRDADMFALEEKKIAIEQQKADAMTMKAVAEKEA